MSDINKFLKAFWIYYLELEKQFVETKRYIELSAKNNSAFSVEYLKLYQAVCSEIDVVGKYIAEDTVPDFKANNHTNIKKWGFNLQKSFGNIKDTLVSVNDLYLVQPFKNWQYEECDIKKSGKIVKELRIVGGKKTIPWWTTYNKVKHQRVGLITGEKYYVLANQKNVVLSLSALYLLEWKYLMSIGDDVSLANISHSQLFEIRQRP